MGFTFEKVGGGWGKGERIFCLLLLYWKQIYFYHQLKTEPKALCGAYTLFMADLLKVRVYDGFIYLITVSSSLFLGTRILALWK